jgi:drug/metabolite transporter (DMT)-like permease
VAICGILLFSTKAIFVKLAYDHGANTMTALALRMIFALPFFIYSIFNLYNKEGTKGLDRKDALYLIVFGLIGYYLASYFDFVGLRYIKASLERLILFSYPTLVIIISHFVFKEKVTTAQIFGVIITYLGIAVIFYPELSWERSNNVLIGGLMVLISAVTYAAYIAGSGWMIPRIGAQKFTSYALMVSAIAVLLHYMVSEYGNYLIIHQPWEVYAYCFGMAIISTVLPTFMISYAIKNLGASQFSVFGALGPVSTITLAYIFLGERLTFTQLLGGIIIILGVWLAERMRTKKITT